MTLTATTVTAPTARPRPPAGSRRAGRSRPSWRSPAYLFILPGFAVFSLVMVYPTVQAFLMSLQDFSLVATKPSQWIGLTNYLDALSDPVFWRALANSGVYMVVTVPGQMVLGLACAIALKNRLKGRSAFRIMVYIPVITSWVVVSILFKFLFQTEGGLVNFILTDVTHLGDSGVDWFNGRWTALVAICALGVWKGVGWTMIIFLAALQSVPDQLYEAAQVDGAGGLAQFWHVTLPSIRRTLLFITIMLVIGAFNVFISVSLMTGGGPANQTQVPLTYLYRQAFNFLDFGYGSAIAFMLTALIALFSAVQFRLGDKAAEEAIA